jgi:hypothetical protein
MKEQRAILRVAADGGAKIVEARVEVISPKAMQLGVAIAGSKVGRSSLTAFALLW